MAEERRKIPVPHGHLEAVFHPGNSEPSRVALILHPHPQFGGDMHNPVVLRAARTLEALGCSTLRFNFRGVGSSTGSWDEGRGELEDARAALDYLLNDRARAGEVLIAGYSFGSVIGLRLGCEDARVHSIVSIATPVRLFDPAFLADCVKPKLFVHGEADDMAPLAPVEGLAAGPGGRLRVIPGAGHFFAYEEDELEGILRTELAHA